MTELPQLKISRRLTGKLEGIDALSVSSFGEPCDLWSQVLPVCAHCYARNYESFRPKVKAAYQHNAAILSETELDESQVPRIHTTYFRFNAFGEVRNATHARNLFRIVRANPQTRFALWTKRASDVVHDWFVGKPSNLNLIFSNPDLDRVEMVERACSFGNIDFDFTFNIYRKENMHARPEWTFECQRKCIDCLKCYRAPAGIREIVEVLK